MKIIGRDFGKLLVEFRSKETPSTPFSIFICLDVKYSDCGDQSRITIGDEKCIVHTNSDNGTIREGYENQPKSVRKLHFGSRLKHFGQRTFVCETAIFQLFLAKL